MKRSKLLYLSWALAIVTLVLIVTTHRKNQTTFYGIAETREMIINTEYPVELKKLHIAPGQTVRHQDLLVEFSRPELAMEINAITHELEELRGQQQANAHEFKSRINALRAQEIAASSDIEYRIRQLQAEYDINRELSARLKSIENSLADASESTAGNPAALRIERLKESRQLSVKPIQIQIDQLEKDLISSEDALRIQVDGLERKHALLLEEKNKLYRFSPVEGIIGSINYKEGEQISPFTPILTLHTKTPSYIRGFIHEKAYRQIALGQKAWVASIADPRNSIVGEVTGVGTRIVEYPPRLKEMLAVPVWGREVTLQIDKQNPFLLGEKVFITPCDRCEEKKTLVQKWTPDYLKQQKSYADVAPLTVPTPQLKANVIQPMVIDHALKGLSSVEASGVIYLHDMKQYLIVSDSTPGNRPLLYLMDRDGLVKDELVIQGLNEAIDMEGITQDDTGRIYIICSHDSSGKQAPPRAKTLLMRIRRDKTLLYLDESVSLYELFADLVSRFPQGSLSELALAGSNRPRVNIEGIAYRESSLYLGLKSPLLADKGAILRIANVNGVFEGKRLTKDQVAVWKRLDLRNSKARIPSGISDLLYHPFDDSWYVLSYAKRKLDDEVVKQGTLWIYREASGKLEEKAVFADRKPEGLAFNPDSSSFIITFDQGREHPGEFAFYRDLS